MHLSISSSNDRLPIGNWLAVWLGIIITLLATILFFEWHLRSIGWSPSVVDSVQLWSEQRKRASMLGEKAIILVGASRMQLGVDLETFRHSTNLSPVQLAIDGTTYVPVLKNLAEDPTITGTVLVSVNAYNLGKGEPNDTSTRWVNYYERTRSQGIEPYRTTHNKIASLLNKIFVARLEGAKPFTVISKLAFKDKSGGNYLVSHPDRSRDADYSKVTMPDFYAARLKRNFAQPVENTGTTFDTFFEAYRKAIYASGPTQLKHFAENLSYIVSLIQKIEARGGKVIFVRFPTGKLIWEADKIRYPREIYWDRITHKNSASIHFSDYASLNSFELPDGSHLDYRDKKAFTAGLIDVLKSTSNL